MRSSIETMMFRKNSIDFEKSLLDVFIQSSAIDPTVGDLVNFVQFGPLWSDEIATVKCFHSRDFGKVSQSFPWFISDKLVIQSMRDFDFRGFQIGCGAFKISCKTEEINTKCL